MRPKKLGDSQVGFWVAMLSVGAMCYYQAHFGRTVLPKWPLWAHLFYSVVYSVSELRRACFRQARVARAVLPPSVLFGAGAFALPPCSPKSHMRLLPHLGVSVQGWVASPVSVPTKRFLCCILGDPTEIPPYRETGVAIPLSHCVSCGITDYRCYTPTSFLKYGISRSKDRANKGGIAEKTCL